MTTKTRALSLWWCLPIAALVLACGGAVEAPEPDPKPEPACQADNDCEVGNICRDGDCQLGVCTKVYDPVCGVDGRTYGNRCMARVAHVAIESVGECTEACGGFRGLPCPKGAICDLPAGLCNGADLQGECVLDPRGGCPEIFRPVCGCDGKTYSNDCERLQARVQKDHDGRCGSTPDS